MEHEPRVATVSPSEKTIPTDRDKTLVAPRFDEKSVQRARPAVPLTRRAAGGFRQTALILACVVAGIIGGMAGGFGLALFRKDAANEPPPPAVVNAPSLPDGVADATLNETAGAEPLQSDVVQRTADDAATGETRETETAPVEKAREAQQPPPGKPSEVVRVGDDGEQAALRGALDEWVAATNTRDIQRQMGFYDQTLRAFYLTRNVPRAAVRAEKSRVFGSADVIDIRADAPDIRLSRDGQTATMRFRKKYAIEGGGQDRRGEVVQELRWQRTAEGWKIVSERDLRVIN